MNILRWRKEFYAKQRKFYFKLILFSIIFALFFVFWLRLVILKKIIIYQRINIIKPVNNDLVSVLLNILSFKLPANIFLTQIKRNANVITLWGSAVSKEEIISWLKQMEQEKIIKKSNIMFFDKTKFKLLFIMS